MPVHDVERFDAERKRLDDAERAIRDMQAKLAGAPLIPRYFEYDYSIGSLGVFKMLSAPDESSTFLMRYGSPNLPGSWRLFIRVKRGKYGEHQFDDVTVQEAQSAIEELQLWIELWRWLGERTGI